MKIFNLIFYFLFHLLTHNIITFAQTPKPVLTIGHSYSPYSRLATDPVAFACSFTYPTLTYTSLTFLYLDFKFISSTTSLDTLVARLSWSSFSQISTGTFSSLATSYTDRIIVAKVSDTGAFKNYSVTLGYSGSTSTPNYYTLTDVGSYYCTITDTTSTTTGSVVALSAYYSVSAVAPSWTNVAAGSTVTMSCSCKSYPSPTGLWQQYQPDNSSAVWTNSSIGTVTSSSSTDSTTGVYTVTSTYSWSVAQNSDGSATYFRYSFRCYCYHTAYSTTYYTYSSGVEFLPTFSLSTPVLYYAPDKSSSWLQSKTLISSYGLILN
jgi:hypothetical protein